MALEKKEKLETTCISLWFRVVNGYLKTMMMMMMMAQIGLMDKVAVEVKLDLDLEWVTWPDAPADSSQISIFIDGVDVYIVGIL